MKPGTTYLPVASSVSTPAYVTEPGDEAVDHRDIRLEPLRVKTESTLPPRTTRSAGSSPRATARRRLEPFHARSVIPPAPKRASNARPASRRALTYSRVVIGAGDWRRRMRRKFVATGSCSRSPSSALVARDDRLRPSPSRSRSRWPSSTRGRTTTAAGRRRTTRGDSPSRRRSGTRCRPPTRRTSSRTHRFRRSSRVSCARATR